MIICGIDNGLSGGITFLDSSTATKNIIAKYVMPIIPGKGTKMEYNIPEMVNIIKKHSPDFVVLEFAQAMPKQGTVSSMHIGKGFGIWLGIINALGISHSIVHPRTWQKKMFEDLNKMDTKQASAIMAHRLFPTENFKATDRCKKDHDGLTDSCCLAYFGFLKQHSEEKCA